MKIPMQMGGVLKYEEVTHTTGTSSSTNASQITNIRTAFNNLSDEDKMNCVLVIYDAIYRPSCKSINANTNWIFTYMLPASNAFYVKSLNIGTAKAYQSTNGGTPSDISNNADANNWYLYKLVQNDS